MQLDKTNYGKNNATMKDSHKKSVKQMCQMLHEKIKHAITL